MRLDDDASFGRLLYFPRDTFVMLVPDPSYSDGGGCAVSSFSLEDAWAVHGKRRVVWSDESTTTFKDVGELVSFLAAVSDMHPNVLLPPPEPDDDGHGVGWRRLSAPEST